MKLYHERCAGLDVHSNLIVACARIAVPGAEATVETRSLGGSMTALLALSDWLSALGVTHVVMESTGVYWKPVWHVLEGHFELVLANAMHVRNMPGRKSDVNDATWLAELLAHGLVRGSFVPPIAIQGLRDLTRMPRVNYSCRTCCLRAGSYPWVGAGIAPVDEVRGTVAQSGATAFPCARRIRAWRVGAWCRHATSAP